MLTLRDPFAPGLWAEAGAMRIPRSHLLTMALVERYGLVAHPFTMDNPQAYCFFGGRRVRHRELAGDPAALGFEVGRARAHAARAALEPRARAVRGASRSTMATVPGRRSRASTTSTPCASSSSPRKWSEGAIEMFGLLFNQEALMNSSFLELLREELGGYYTDLVYLDGGTDRCRAPSCPSSRRGIRFGAKVVAVDQSTPA